MGAVSVSLSLLSIPVANTVITYNNDLITFSLLYLPDEKLLTHLWQSFSKHSCPVVCSIFTHIGDQYWHDTLQWPSLWLNTRLARPIILDNQLTLIFWMGQRVCYCLIWHSGSPYLIDSGCYKWLLRLLKMQDQKSMTLRWLLYSGFGRECLSLFFDYNANQYIKKWQ